MKIGKISLWIFGLLAISIITLYTYDGVLEKVTPMLEKCGLISLGNKEFK